MLQYVVLAFQIKQFCPADWRKQTWPHSLAKLKRARFCEKLCSRQDFNALTKGIWAFLEMSVETALWPYWT